MPFISIVLQLYVGQMAHFGRRNFPARPPRPCVRPYQPSSSVGSLSHTPTHPPPTIDTESESGPCNFGPQCIGLDCTFGLSALCHACQTGG